MEGGGHVRPARGCILPAYDPLLDSSIRHILVRHEQGAAGHRRGVRTCRPAPCGHGDGWPRPPGLVTPLCDAYMDSIPMVAITGQVPTTAIGTDAFQECDTVGITRSVTKHNELVATPEDLPLLAIRQAFHIADRPAGPRSWSTCPRTCSRTRWSGTGRATSPSPTRCPATGPR